MGQDDKNELQLFEDIIRGQELRDEGIVSHDAALRELEAEIKERYIKRGFVAIPEEDFEALEEKANEHWPYHDKVATVSGRLEILFDEDEEVLSRLLEGIAVPDATGEILHPSGDELYCINVDKAKIRSSNVVIDAICDDDGKLEDVRVGYTFYLLSDSEEDVALFAQPDALDSHTYDTPTPSEARARLEHGWSSQIEGIDSIIRMDEVLPHRLMLLAETYNDELKDATFRELVELYINDELALDMAMPYMILVRDRIDCLDDIADESAEWRQLAIEGALTLFVNEPEVRFTSVTDGPEKDPEAFIFGMTFNDEYGSKPEVVAVPVRNIDRFFSTRASSSLADRAIASMDRTLELDMQTMLESKNDVTFAEVETDEVDMPEYIRQLEILEETMGRVQKLADEYLMHSFTTYQDAKSDAKLLLEKITEQLNGTMFSQGAHRVEAMGERIKIANLRYDMQWDEAQNILVHGVDKEQPIIELPLGDFIIGGTDELYAVAESTIVPVEEDNKLVFYTPRVVMGVVTSEGVGHVLDSEPSLSQLTFRNVAAVPLDSSSDIQFVVLDRYRAGIEVVQRAKKVYGDDSPFMNNILKLEEAFNNENPSEYSQLEPSVLAGFATDVGAVREQQKAVAPLIETLEVMIGSRNILAVGDVLQRDGEGEYTPDTERTGKLTGWTIIDIKASESESEIMLFVMSQYNKEYRYIPMSSIKEFRF